MKKPKRILKNYSGSLYKKTKLNRIETPLDGLYDLLKKKDLKVSSIMKKFDINKEIALEWCNILTNNKLAEFTYPLFGEPVLKLKNEEK